LEFLDFPGESGVPERNLLEKYDTHRGNPCSAMEGVVFQPTGKSASEQQLSVLSPNLWGKFTKWNWLYPLGCL